MQEPYCKWVSMLNRCYGNHEGNNYCYKGVYVCDEWHNYQNFADWFYANYPKDGRRYDLDKDLLSGDVKIYSPKTCTFLTSAKNTQVSHAKEWRFISPDGEEVSIYNLSKFCKENDLLDCKMSLVNSGKRKHHRGWVKLTPKPLTVDKS